VYLSHLGLTNFRNFPLLELDLPEGVVVLFGGNAQGKSSLVEAIYLLCIARSFRADNDYELVNWDTAAEDGETLVGGTFERLNDRLRVYVGYRCVPPTTTLGQDQGNAKPFGVRRQIRVSRMRRTAAELVGLVNAVLFTADDIDLVQGPPSVRRRFLDILISQADPPYLKTLQRYQRVLQQRNRLLKALQDRSAEHQELVFWDEELVKEGAWLVAKRCEVMGNLNNIARERHQDLTGASEELVVGYLPNVPQTGIMSGSPQIQEEFSAALEASRRRELAMGSTVVGPHRDDFRIMVNGKDMGTYASRGQARTLALSLKLAEAAYLASMKGEAPIILLDDVLSEMDSFRRSRVLDKATQYQQVVITTTDPQLIQDSEVPEPSYYRVEDGRVEAVTCSA